MLDLKSQPVESQPITEKHTTLAETVKTGYS